MFTLAWGLQKFPEGRLLIFFVQNKIVPFVNYKPSPLLNVSLQYSVYSVLECHL